MNSILEKKIFNKRNLPYLLGKNVLVAVSGGIDSMVLLDLLLQINVTMHIAHVDHSTRAGASHKDANFVKQFCLKNDLPFHLKTYKHSSGNFQSEARKYRYGFFQTLVEENNLDYVLTAHHLDDRIEGMLLSCFRGSGLKGLLSPFHQELNLLRPLIHFNKKDIIAYAEKNKILHITDASNNDNTYHRNLIRNELLPTMTDSIPQGKKGLYKTLLNLEKDQLLLENLANHLMPNYLDTVSDSTIINLEKISDDGLIDLYFHYVRPFGFTNDQMKKSLKATTGSHFLSATHKLLKNRKNVILQAVQKKPSIDLCIDKPGAYKYLGKTIQLSQRKIEETSEPTSNEITFSAKLPLILTIRSWRPGDIFKPAGMKGKSKKIKKLLSDLKLDLFTKEKIIIVASERKILWVYPYRKAEINQNLDETLFRLKIE